MRELVLYRESTGEAIEAHAIVATIAGMAEVTCSRCGAVRQFEPGEEALADLMVRFGRSVVTVDHDEPEQ